jgi:hypothetical protein
MIGIQKLVGLYVQPDQEREVEAQRFLVPGFAVEVIEVEGRETPGEGRVFESRIFGLTRREKNRPRPYSTPLREAMRRWWEVETYGAAVPEELLEGGGKETSRNEERRLALADATPAPAGKPERGAEATTPLSEQTNPRERS